MNDHKKSIFEFVKERHPKYKEKSAMFKRKASQYGREVLFYKQTFKDYEEKTTKEILERLYPKDNKPSLKSLTIIFD